MLNRRRFLTIAVVASLPPAIAHAETHVETGIALGARVSLRLSHPEAPALAAAAMGEIRRLEAIFSLYQTDSALACLNRDGSLQNPPFELLDCLTLAGAVHRASGGRFDPTVQPLWLAEARATSRRRSLSPAERADAVALTGWRDVRLKSTGITLRKGQALTLNGIAQGYIADRVAGFLAARGLTRALIDTGEMVALPEGDWPVQLPSRERLALSGRALATSAPQGMTFGDDGRRSHILDPVSGHPVDSRWRAVSISAPSAALADALSTAACLTDGPEELKTLCASFPAANLVTAIPT
ncbi:FAD:protein FMN transferase [Sedimentimonas flavescens]|uniref:FAD:protein FMN transferase n=1 Tax=Sedimentimonas flavescens TaxID=2851012 RepID=UPI001C49F113|nr:FAD:protein FMN transferase [Sedimentimonas flavescens]MBW0159663.1 FAD:protein FMN transferase [Sedimentimonas flavescens]